MEEKNESLLKWRLILGQPADPEGKVPLDGTYQSMDKPLGALYDSDRKGGLGSSSPNVLRWLGDIRKYFPASVVQVMQKDALDRLGIQRMLLEKELLESVVPDIQLVATLLSLSKMIPEQTRHTARLLVAKVVEEVEKKLRFPLQQAIRGSINRAVANRHPKHNEVDWHKTIRQNIKNYDTRLKTIIPDRIFGYSNRNHAMRQVILLIDQSGSMATSVVYAGILGSIMASIRSVKTSFVVFDTAVVDLTSHLDDPVDLLFATQLGGGTDIHKALLYAKSLVITPADTVLVLISDLYEGGSAGAMMTEVAAIQSSGVQFITLLALNDEGAPAYHHEMAARMADLHIPCFACTPDRFPELIADAIRKVPVRIS